MEILEESGIKADEEGFLACMEQQKEKARAARKSDDEIAWQDEELGFFTSEEATVFTGYDTLTDEGTVIALLKDRKPADSISAGDEGDRSNSRPYAILCGDGRHRPATGA